MKILITGGAGFIGSQIGHYLQDYDHEIVLVDNMSYGQKDNLIVDGKPVGTFIEADIRDRSFHDLCQGVDIIIHFAGIAPLPDCQMNPYRAIDNNVSGTANVLECARNNGVKKVIFSSTSAIYENSKNTPFVENDLEAEPNLIYATTKRQSEILCKGFCDVYGMDIVTLRFFNVYGPHQDFRRKHPPLMGYITKCLLNGEHPTFYSNGHQKRDYVYISDLVRLVNTILERDDLAGETFNVCSGETISVREIYDFYQEAFGVFLEPTFKESIRFWDKYPELFAGKYPLKENRLTAEVEKFALGSFAKAKRILNWQPEVDFRSGIFECAAYAKKLKVAPPYGVMEPHKTEKRGATGANPTN